MKNKILHIHQDKKFIIDSKMFLNTHFDNTLVFIGDQNFKTNEDIIFLKETDYDVIVDLCNQYDGVVFYSLNIYFSKIILKIDKGIKVFWRFFGYELYADKKKKYLMSATYSLLKKIGVIENFYMKTKIFFYNLLIKNTIKLKKNAIDRVDFFLGLYEEEFKQLQQDYKLKMRFIPIVIDIKAFGLNRDLVYKKEKTNRIIIGNSGAYWNNHIDIINNLTSNYQDFKHYQFNLFFSYGAKEKYESYIKDSIKKYKNITLITEFLSKEKYIETLLNHDVLVINSLRQHAAGNILTAMFYGLKVYLNQNNSYYHFLIKKGFIVSTIQEFYTDLSNNNTVLSEEQTIHNRKCIMEIYNDEKLKEFSDKVLNLF